MTVYVNDYHAKLAKLRGGWKPVDFSKQLRITEGDILIASDIHVPYHDERVLANFLETALSFGVEAIVWLGDLLDNPTFSSWGQDDPTTYFERELTIVEGIIRMAADVVGKQYWSLGNHEDRWMRRNGHQVSMHRLAGMAGLGDLVMDGTLVVSDNPTLDYRWGNKEWMLTHPAQYGSVPLVVPGELAERFGKNVISAHAHHWAQGKSKSGRFEVIESGCMLDPKLVKYVQHRVTTHRQWNQGYVHLAYGRAELYRGDE